MRCNNGSPTSLDKLLIHMLALLAPIAFCSAALASGNKFVGSNGCISCHQQAYEDWKLSDHNRAMAIASPASVLGNFTGKPVSFHDIQSRFFNRGGKYYVETIGADKKSQEFLIGYTFGHYPLQQYLVETEGGHLQALNIAWDAREAKAGGQRWIHLQPTENITVDSPFFWTRHLQNWNSRCAECHSTNLRKNYDVQQATFQTTWSEINVACEACHGPGSLHIQRAESSLLDQGSGLAITPHRRQWNFIAGEPIAQAAGTKSDSYIDMCGGCHSRRAVIAGIDAGNNYHDRYQLALLGENLYHVDGQIQDEVYVLGSFLQSKMQAQGVTCMDCHRPHSGKLVLQGNSLCSQCHLQEEFDTEKHHFHPPGSGGSQCVECHMPETTYMLVDNRRDHRFGIPNPRLSQQLGTPNACNGCHKGTTPAWASEVLANRLGEIPAADTHSAVTALARQGDPTMTRPILALLEDPSTAAIRKATLLELLSAFPSRVSVEATKGYLSHADPLVRIGAVKSLVSAPTQVRWQLLSPLIKDPVKSVRMEVAFTLSDTADDIPPGKTGLFNSVIQEYRSSLSESFDMPSTQTTVGNLELNLGDPAAAELAYQKALAIEPDYIPALLNLADLHRRNGREDSATSLLQRALAFAPDSGAANFSYGLSLVRQQKYEQALPYLEAATHQLDSQPRYAYVYAVALDSVSRTADALAYLEQATLSWPNQYDLLMAQVLYMEKLGRSKDVLVPLSKLSRIAPDRPEVRSRVHRYIRN